MEIGRATRCACWRAVGILQFFLSLRTHVSPGQSPLIGVGTKQGTSALLDANAEFTSHRQDLVLGARSSVPETDVLSQEGTLS
jgi:hypothetical protein